MGCVSPSREAALARYRLRHTCPQAHLHTPVPEGYSAWHAWAEQISRTHVQESCPGCGCWLIWRERRPEETPRHFDSESDKS